MRKLIPAFLMLAAPVFGAAGPAEVELKLERQVPAVFPIRLIDEGLTHGEARALAQVDESGAVSDILVFAYSHEGFAREALRVLPRWRFRPPLVGGAPTGAVVEVDFRFENYGVLVREVPIGVDAYAAVRAAGYAYLPCPPESLDRRPAATRQVAPSYPADLRERNVAGRVRVRFYIDEAGLPRMPVPVEGSAELGARAVAALRQWRFEPPTRGGRPVLVYAEKEFVFGL